MIGNLISANVGGSGGGGGFSFHRVFLLKLTTESDHGEMRIISAVLAWITLNLPSNDAHLPNHNTGSAILASPEWHRSSRTPPTPPQLPVLPLCALPQLRAYASPTGNPASNHMCHFLKTPAIAQFYHRD